MLEIGYKLCSEEQAAPDLARFAAMAEQAGFTFAAISDHFHPWVDEQGQSPFVWASLGAIAQTTERLRVGTGVTCPTIRTHPAIIAQAAATIETLMPGRFFLGVGTGENLNEHILGDRWPAISIRREMLREAVEVIRALWEGGNTSHRGKHYTVENARIYSIPDAPPPIYVAASGPKAIQLAGEIGDGFIGLAPDREQVAAFEKAGGAGKPKLAEVAVCYAKDEAEARRTAHRCWPNAGIKGELAQELALPRHFEQAAEMVSEDDMAEAVVCGPDPEAHIAKIREYADTGYDHVWVHEIGPDQEPFFEFYANEVLPKLG